MTNSAESDYAALAGDVAATLNAIVLASDATARLNMAVAARRRLATWPRDHYGYRADDVSEMLGLLDEAISGLRVAAGESSFAIDLVATMHRATRAIRSRCQNAVGGRVHHTRDCRGEGDRHRRRFACRFFAV